MVNALKSLIIYQLKLVYGPGTIVYDEPIKQGLKTPAFLLLIINNHQERKLGRNSKRTYTVNITYFPHTAERRGECDEVLQTFHNEFRYIGNQFHAHKIEGSVVDEVLVITFNVSGLVRQVVNETLMQTLKFGGVRID